MKDPYGYRPYRGSRVRRRGIIINTLLGIAIAAAAVWVLCLLLPLDEGGLRFPGQGEGGSSVSDGPDTADSGGQGGSPSDTEGTGPAGSPGQDAPGGTPENGTGGAPDGEGTAGPEPAKPLAGPPAAATDSTQAPVRFGLRKNPEKAEPLWGALPKSPKDNRMVLVSAEDFARETDRLLALFESGAITGVAVTVKDERGVVYYPSAIPEIQDKPSILQPAGGFTDAVSRLRSGGVPLTAVVYTHCDDRYSRIDEDLAVQNINGVGWRDGAMRIYLDPADEEATAYLAAVAAELDALGFQELLLRGLGYPSSGWLARIAYPEDRFGTVTGFVGKVREAVQTARVSVWLDSPDYAVNSDTGQAVKELYETASRVFAEVPDGSSAQALQAGVAAAAGGSGKLVVCTSDTLAALPAVLLDVPLGQLS